MLQRYVTRYPYAPAILIGFVLAVHSPGAGAKALFETEVFRGREILRCGFELGVWGGDAMLWTQESSRRGNNAAMVVADGTTPSIKTASSELFDVTNSDCVTVSVWTFVQELEAGEVHVRVNFLDGKGVTIKRAGKSFGHAEMVLRIREPESDWTYHITAIPKESWPEGAHYIALKSYWEKSSDSPGSNPKGVYLLDEIVVNLHSSANPPQADLISHEKNLTRNFDEAQSRFYAKMRAEWPKNKWRSTPMQKRTCPETGRDFYKLTNMTGNNHHIYFNRPNFSGDGRYLYFLSDRTDSWELYAYDLEDEKTCRLTDDDLDQFTRPAVDQDSSRIYYVVNGRELVQLDVHSGERTTLYEHPTPTRGDFQLMDMSRDGAYLGFLEIEKVDRGEDIQELFTTLHSERVRCAFWIYRLADGAVWKVWQEHRSLQHLLFNPKDSSQILYCHEGPWHKVDQRMWLMDLKGGNKRPLRYEEHQGIRIGHEFWMPDGKHVAYKYLFPAENKRASIRIVNIDTDEETILVEEDFSHFIGDGSGTRFVGDGPKAVKLLDTNVGRVEPLVFHGQELTVRNTHYHPHPAFSPNGDLVVFCMNDSGSNDVALIYLDENPGESR